MRGLAGERGAEASGTRGGVEAVVSAFGAAVGLDEPVSELN